jgi:hypothetical protein
MAFLIAGMKEAGLGLIPGLLANVGVKTGRENDKSSVSAEKEDNTWDFIQSLNTQIVANLGGAWDSPPPDEYYDFSGLDFLSEQADEVVDRQSDIELWGWSDQLNTFTLPFWLRFLPDLKIIVCLRNPVECAHQHNKSTGHSFQFGLQLWQEHYARLEKNLETDQRLITHYDSYLSNPRAEIERVLKFIGAEAEEDKLEETWKLAEAFKKCEENSIAVLYQTKLPEEITRIYTSLCKDAGPVFRKQQIRRISTGDESELVKNILESQFLPRIVVLQKELNRKEQKIRGNEKEIAELEKDKEEALQEISLLKIFIEGLSSSGDYILLPRTILWDHFKLILPEIQQKFYGTKIYVLEPDPNYLYSYPSFAQVIPYTRKSTSWHAIKKTLRGKLDFSDCQAILIPVIGDEPKHSDLLKLVEIHPNKPTLALKVAEGFEIQSIVRSAKDTTKIAQPFLLLPRSCDFMNFQAVLTVVRKRFHLMKPIIVEANPANMGLYPPDVIVLQYKGNRFYANSMWKQLSEKLDWDYCSTVVIPLYTESTKGYEELLGFAARLHNATHLVATPGGRLRKLFRV